MFFVRILKSTKEEFLKIFEQLFSELYDYIILTADSENSDNSSSFYSNEDEDENSDENSILYSNEDEKQITIKQPLIDERLNENIVNTNNNINNKYKKNQIDDISNFFSSEDEDSKRNNESLKK